jgi:hypothetical protein
MTKLQELQIQILRLETRISTIGQAKWALEGGSFPAERSKIIDGWLKEDQEQLQKLENLLGENND